MSRDPRKSLPALWRPRSLQARQLLSASIGLVAFLALAGFALDRAFLAVAGEGLQERLKSYAYDYAGAIEFARDGSLIAPDRSPNGRFDRPGGGLYAVVVLPNGQWASTSAAGQQVPVARMLGPLQEEFTQPLPMTRSDGSEGMVYRYGLGMIDASRGEQAEFPYTIYVMEDAGVLPQQVATFRGALWVNLVIAGLLLLLLQASVLRWSLRPMRNVIEELKRVQRGQADRMSPLHPRELAPLTDSINAFIDSERVQMDRQRNTLADLAHSLKTPLAVLRTQLDSDAEPEALRAELDTQLQRMNALVSYQLARAASGGHKLFAAEVAVEPIAESIVQGLEKIHAAKGTLCEFEIDPAARFYGETGDLQELLGNLLENAFKWARSRVLLTVQPETGGEGRRPGLLLAVDDDGPGIPQEQVERVLQRGVRGDERVQGHGIGLAIVQDIVQGYDGTLRVERSPELGGARFEVRLPPGP